VLLRRSAKPRASTLAPHLELARHSAGSTASIGRVLVRKRPLTWRAASRSASNRASAAPAPSPRTSSAAASASVGTKPMSTALAPTPPLQFAAPPTTWSQDTHELYDDDDEDDGDLLCLPSAVPNAATNAALATATSAAVTAAPPSSGRTSRAACSSSMACNEAT